MLPSPPLSSLPDALLDRLLPGLIEPARLTDAALALLQASGDRAGADPDETSPSGGRFVRLALDLLRAAWEESPQDLACAAGFAGLAEKLGIFDPGVSLAGKVARGRLDPSEAIAWRQAEAAYATGAFDVAAERYAVLQERCGLASFASRAADCALRVGLRDSAVAVWRRLLSERPWDVNLALRLYDLVHGVDGPCEEAASPQPTAVCMITRDRAAILDEGLAALTADWPAGCSLTLLDNGSTDATPHVAEEWLARLGPERMRFVRLPVDVGRAAARNWIRSLLADEPRPFVLLLDDLVRPAPDSLGRLQQAARLYPNAAAWGAKIVGHDGPPGARVRRVLAADLHLRADDGPAGGVGDLGGLGGLGRWKAGALDALRAGQPWGIDDGRLDYARPCAHVRAACCLTRTRDFLSGPDFDPRLGYGRLEDLDRDLTLLSAGGHVAYSGHATATRFAVPGDPSASCDVDEAAARLVLAGKRPGPVQDELLTRQRELLRADVMTKLRALGF